MGRGKAVKHELKNIYVEYSCSKCGKTFKTKVKDYDMNAHTQQCEMCGEHGDIIVDITCEGCGKHIDLEIRNW